MWRNGVDTNHLTWDKDQWRAFVNTGSMECVVQKHFFWLLRIKERRRPPRLSDGYHAALSADKSGQSAKVTIHFHLMSSVQVCDLHTFHLGLRWVVFGHRHLASFEGSTALQLRIPFFWGTRLRKIPDSLRNDKTEGIWKDASVAQWRYTHSSPSAISNFAISDMQLLKK